MSGCSEAYWWVLAASAFAASAVTPVLKHVVGWQSGLWTCVVGLAVTFALFFATMLRRGRPRNR